MLAAHRMKLGALLCLMPAALGWPALARAGDPQSYRVEMASTGDSARDDTLKATSDLINLRKTAPVGPFALIGRARGDLDRLKTVLESYGYYQSYVDIKIDGLALDDPALGEELSARAGDNEARVKITFSLGQLYHLRHIRIDGEVPSSAQGALGLAPGEPAVAANVLAAGERLQTALADQGYAFAKVDPPVAQEDPPDRVLDVSFHVVTGPRVKIGDIRIRGLKEVDEDYVRRRLLVHSGEEYGASKIESARKDLLATGVFSSVSVQLGTQQQSQNGVPVTFRVRERPRHAASINAAYSSDLGGSAGFNWTDRDLTGKADQLTFSASAINLGGGTATTGIGYDVRGQYLIPDWKMRDQSLQTGIGALRQQLEAYTQTALNLGMTVNRKLSDIWSANAGITAEEERIDQECVTRYYTLLALPLSATYNTTGLSSPLVDPTKGVRATASVAPTLSVRSSSSLDAGCPSSALPQIAGAQPTAGFLVTQVSIAYYLDLNWLHLSATPGRRILAMRALGGLAAGANEFSLPPDQRFYAGGSGTIRGYRYQSIGPLFPDGNPKGGTAIAAGSIEYRQRIGGNLGMAVFVDGGQVSDTLNVLAGTLRFGGGAGARYYTPIGPIRVDLAVPLGRKMGDDTFEIYIGLGQAF
jgi:translocation and assembly module TamA